MKMQVRILFEGEVVFDTFTNLSPAVAEAISASKETQTQKHERVRYGRIDKSGMTAFFATIDSDFVKSSSSFRNEMEIFFEVFSCLRDQFQKLKAAGKEESSRLVHNLESLTGHISQEVYSIVDQATISRMDWRDQIKYAEEQIRKNPSNVAQALLMIARNNAAIGYEISIHRKLRNSSPKLNKDNHVVHKVVMNVLHQFFSDFVDKNVRVIVHPSEGIACFDYESVRVAMYHLIQNAVKYIQDGTHLNVSFYESESDVRISFDMSSIQVSKDEAAKIFESGFSGALARRFRLSGDGQGMFIVRQIAELNSGTVSFQSSNQIVLVDGRPYQNNIFDLTLPKT